MERSNQSRWTTSRTILIWCSNKLSTQGFAFSWGRSSRGWAAYSRSRVCASSTLRQKLRVWSVEYQTTTINGPAWLSFKSTLWRSMATMRIQNRFKKFWDTWQSWKRIWDRPFWDLLLAVPGCRLVGSHLWSRTWRWCGRMCQSQTKRILQWWPATTILRCLSTQVMRF